MEPAAPGTEDDIKPIQQYNKQESEKERLLSIKARLPNNKYGNVFEFSYQNGGEMWYCNLCECPIMGKVYHHEIGKRHTSNMQAAGLQPSTNSETGSISDLNQTTLLVAPGEPVPPGFESEAFKITEIQERLDNYKVGPLIGLEYLLEIHEYDRDKEPSYLCILCDKRGDPRTVIAHLVSYNHMSQYLQRHFVLCYRALSPYITKQYKPNWQSVMTQIVEAIEQKYGRLKPLYVERAMFDQKRAEYQHMIAMGPHFTDKNGCTFEELVDKEQLTKPIAEEPVKVIKPSEDVSKRPYRKTGTVPGADEVNTKKKSPSPPVVKRPKKPKTRSNNKTGSNNNTNNRNANNKLKQRRTSLSSVSSISSSDLSDFEPFPRKGDKKETSNKRNRSRSRSPSPNSRYKNRKLRSPKKGSFSNDREKDKQEYKLPPWQRANYVRSRTESADENRKKNHAEKLEQYKKLAAAIDNDMEKIRKQHEQNPEKHPQYNEEWKQFWNKRYKELQLEGKDATTYDFKPEWIQFWNKRVIELHNAEIKSRKDALRKRLGLPEEPAPICFKITGKKKPGATDATKASKPTPVAAVPDQDPDVIVIDDKDDETVSSKRSHSPRDQSKYLRGKARERSRSRERSYDRGRSRGRSHDRERSRGRSHDRERSRGRSRERDYRSRERYSPSWNKRYIERDMYYHDAYKRSYLPDYIKPPRVMRDVTRYPVPSPPLRSKMEPEPELDIEVNIVNVLRLLTALEEKLGSLGPKVIDLLAQALAMEKNKANSSETLLDNEVNCVLFETVKEKLKGQLLAGLVDQVQTKAFKNAIKKTAELIHFAEERRKQKEKEKPKQEPLTVPGIGTVDKAAIAKQIATALVMQGKTDVTQQELEQLINAVVGMAEASKNSDKPINTASFLQQFAEQKSKISESLTAVSGVPSQRKKSSSPSSSSTMEGLSDSDLQTLLQNFKDLSPDEQHGLISYLKKLEAREPERVEKLRKFVKLESGGGGEEEEEGSGKKQGEKQQEKVEGSGGRMSPFSNRIDGSNPMLEENDEEKDEDEDENDSVKEEKNKKESTTKINLDSEDEEYSYEDVFKAATKNVTEKEREKEKKKMEAKAELSDAKALIANLMGQLGAKNSAPREPPSVSIGTSAISASFTQTLSNLPISMANLASIVSTANRNSDIASSLSLTENLPILGKALSNIANPVKTVPSDNFDRSGHPENNLPKGIPSMVSGAEFGYSKDAVGMMDRNRALTQNMANINNPNVQGMGYPNLGMDYRGQASRMEPGMGYGGPTMSHGGSGMGPGIAPGGGPTRSNMGPGIQSLGPGGPGMGSGGLNMMPSGQGVGPRHPPADLGPVHYPAKGDVYGNQYQRGMDYPSGNAYGAPYAASGGGGGPPRGYPEYDQTRMGSQSNYPNRNMYGRPANYGNRW